ncbi:hypothetical protein QAD02_012470 [Eretmocerus hayati]|uniref:Uncharacterized protein n=1 Tax=Eretmocerus hayati TaxID=131215 RepID=A0ACC2P0M8_9HYME|nr:hypothetical protein QAD02_012470 [Eretmocerus hayati]
MIKLLLISFVFASANLRANGHCFKGNYPYHYPPRTVLPPIETRAKEKIVGGEYVKITEVPHLAQILLDGSLICGASIINEEWLVTAAHCMSQKRGLTVLTGSTNQGRGGEQHQIAQIIVHEDYNESLVDNDIALIKVTKPIEFKDSQKPIPIATQPPRAGQEMEIAGFGREGDKLATSDVVKLAVVPVVDQQVCAKNYAQDGGITENMFCAGVGTADSCSGDSGGPGIINGRLAGIVSFGKSCNDPEHPGVYTRVQKYRRWIENYTGIYF